MKVTLIRISLFFLGLSSTLYAQGKLENTKWTVVEISTIPNGKDSLSLEVQKMKSSYLQIKSSNRAALITDCNQCVAKHELETKIGRFYSISCTEKSCDTEANENEKLFTKALAAMTVFRFEEEVLVLDYKTSETKGSIYCKPYSK